MNNENKTAEQGCDELRAERDEALARCAAWEQESESNRKRICRMLELDERTPASSLMNAIGMLVSGAKARAEMAGGLEDALARNAQLAREVFDLRRELADMRRMP